MLGHFGFSYIGLFYLLMLIIPNLIWSKCLPAGYDPTNENRFLLIMERVGQVLVTCTALMFLDYNLGPWSLWSMWLAASALLMILYELWWIRYFRSERRLEDFYSSFLGLPVAGASLPVIAFLMLGIYGKVIWLIISVIILGIGHIGIHIGHLKALRK